MKIALLSPIAWRTPPRIFGPVEQVVSLLAEGLVRRGIDVTLFATGDSETRARLWSVVPRPYMEEEIGRPEIQESLHVSELFENAAGYDLIHNHMDFLPLTYTQLVDTPILTTIHGAIPPQLLPVYRKYNHRVQYVSISDASRVPELDYVATVHNGLELTQFPLVEEPEDYLLFFSRILPEKGVLEAVEIAKQTDMRLVIAGWILDQEYFDRKVKPLVDGKQIQYLGAVEAQERAQILGRAKALLNPILTDEPYGMSVVEAFACGTPVIAFNKGAMPELVQSGVNGFLVNNLGSAVEAVKKIDTISRARCRETAEDYYSQARMVDDYINIYRTVIAKYGRDGRRPWGHYKVLSYLPGEKVKRVVVEPGKRLSLQRHRFRSEHWYIVQGEAAVTRNGEEIRLAAGQSIEIPMGAVHRIENPGSGLLVFIEVQQGDYVGEDDIERLQDDYGRKVNPSE